MLYMYVNIINFLAWIYVFISAYAAFKNYYLRNRNRHNHYKIVALE